LPPVVRDVGARDFSDWNVIPYLRVDRDSQKIRRISA
jgi:hypothetical protein